MLEATHNSRGGLLIQQCTLEVKGTPSSSLITLELETLYTKGLKKNVGGYPVTTNCYDYKA